MQLFELGRGQEPGHGKIFEAPEIEIVFHGREHLAG